MKLSRWVPQALLLGTTACSAAGDHERLGDQAYGESRYAQALAEYRQVLADNPDARVWAKAGAAALRTGNLEVAADAYLKLAAEDPTRAEEAAEGLETVARAAERGGDGKRLQAAVIGLGAIAPDRSTGRYALELIRRPGAEATDLVAVLPGAIAVAPDPQTVDSLLVVYGAALRETSGCGEALGAFQAGLRRTKVAALRNRAEEGVAACSLWVGLRSEALGKPQDAVLWFAAAIRIDSSTTVGRRALVGYGDARLHLGDTIGGALAYQTVVSDAVQSDSIHQMALDRLAELRGRAPFDSARIILQ
ncbi:MAG TPA: tetratricopeptide repeat protein [Gemmatimonadales bacterium]|nr:tetratricopeptide repeat protein [Gemmatimonadales bacterium]